VSTRGVCNRYGVKNLRTARRWEIQKVIPPPDFRINNRKYWWESTLDRHDRQRVVERATTRITPERSPSIADADLRMQAAPENSGLGKTSSVTTGCKHKPHPDERRSDAWTQIRQRRPATTSKTLPAGSGKR